MTDAMRAISSLPAGHSETGQRESLARLPQPQHRSLTKHIPRHVGLLSQHPDMTSDTSDVL
jgi:hypothetical protein